MTKSVLIHTMPPPSSIDGLNPAGDYMANNFMVPAVEGANPAVPGSGRDHTRYGGFWRDRLKPMEVTWPQPAGYEYRAWRTEIDRLRTIGGVNGMIMNVQESTGNGLRRAQELALACQDDGVMKMAVDPDMSSFNSFTATQLFTMVKAIIDAGPNGIFRITDGRMLICPYMADSYYMTKTFWDSFNTQMVNAYGAGSWALMPMPNGMNSTVTTLFDPLSYVCGFSEWGDGDPDSIGGLAADPGAMRARRPGSIWMHPVRFQDSRPVDQIYNEPYGSKLLRNTWQQAMDLATGPNDLVQMVTLNDWAEGSGMGVSLKSPDGSVLKISKRYGEKWKVNLALGLPSVDRVHLFNRDQLVSPIIRTAQQLTAGQSYATIQVNPADLTASVVAMLTTSPVTKLTFRYGTTVTIAATPAVGATSIQVSSFTPATTWPTGTEMIRRRWTYNSPSGIDMAMVNRKRGNLGSPTGATETSKIWDLVTDLTAEAAVTVVDGNGTRTFTAPAGMNSWPQPEAVGFIDVTVVRGTKTILTCRSAVSTSATPSVQNMMYYTNSAESTPSGGDASGVWTEVGATMVRAPSGWAQSSRKVLMPVGGS